MTRLISPTRILSPAQLTTFLLAACAQEAMERTSTPPHTKGAGTKTYTFTVYALSEPAHLPGPPEQVTDAALPAAIKGKVLASADLSVTHTRRPAEPARHPRAKNLTQSRRGA